MLDHDFGHMCFGRRIQISGHSDFAIFNDLGASSIFPACKLILRLLLVLRTTGSVAMASITVADVICDADEPCFVNTA